jgi:hypothetical protein
LPVAILYGGLELVEAVGVFPDEVTIKNGITTSLQGVFFEIERTLAMPIMAAVSPPVLIWWYCEVIRVGDLISISAGDCGFTNSTSPRT